MTFKAEVHNFAVVWCTDVVVLDPAPPLNRSYSVTLAIAEYTDGRGCEL